MKATGIVRRVDDLGRIVIPKEIRRTLKIREGDPSRTTLTLKERLSIALHSILKRYKEQGAVAKQKFATALNFVLKVL